jgi:hypothetical protein
MHKNQGLVIVILFYGNIVYVKHASHEDYWWESQRERDH